LADISELEKTIGHTFASRDLLLRALTHSSHTHEHSSGELAHNEQMEFLGDAILGFIVSTW
jgi:dsRNA-specific ribonuclease